MSLLEVGGPFVLKIMFDIIMYVDNSALRFLMENLQNIWMKDISGENIGTTVSYMKGELLLLQNCNKVPIETIGLLRDIFCCIKCEEFTTFMSNVYYNHKRNTHVVDYMDYLTLAESEYRTLYRKGKWTESKSDPVSGFFITPSNNDGTSKETECGGGCN